MFVVKALSSSPMAFICFFSLLLKLDLILVGLFKEATPELSIPLLPVYEFYSLLCLLPFYPWFLAFHPFELKSQCLYFPFVLLNSKSI